VDKFAHNCKRPIRSRDIKHDGAKNLDMEGITLRERRRKNNLDTEDTTLSERRGKKEIRYGRYNVK
jgi:hypothetical protein